MSGFIARQQNGLICRHSTICDCITEYNMTEEQYIDLCEKERGISRKDAVETISNYMRDIPEVIEWYCPNNMSVNQFEKMWEDMKRPKEQCEYTRTVCDVKNVDEELKAWEKVKRRLLTSIITI